MGVHWRRNQAGSGLLVGYVLTEGLLYLTGASMFVFPSADLFMSRDVVLDGFRQCVYGTAAFAVGSIVFAHLFSPSGLGLETERKSESRGTARDAGTSSTLSSSRQKTVAHIYLGVGILSYPLLASFIGRLPSVKAVVSMSQYLVLVGLCLLCWIAWKRENRGRLWVLLALALLFPVVTMLTRGFAGYGIRAFLIIAAFVATFYRPRWHMVALGTVLVYGGLSLYIGYMSQRGELRDAVWGSSGYGARWEQVDDIASKAEWFTPTDPTHVGPVVGRLNLSYHVGIATNYVGANRDYAGGDALAGDDRSYSASPLAQQASRSGESRPRVHVYGAHLRSGNERGSGACSGVVYQLRDVGDRLRISSVWYACY